MPDNFILAAIFQCPCQEDCTKGIAIVKMTSNQSTCKRFCSFWAKVLPNTPKGNDVIESYFASVRDLSFESQSKMNPKFLTNALGSVSWSSNNIGNRSLNISFTKTRF